MSHNSVSIDGINCYGTMADDNNYHVVYDDSQGYEEETIFTTIEEKTWAGVVTIVKETLVGSEIYEISAV